MKKQRDVRYSIPVMEEIIERSEIMLIMLRISRSTEEAEEALEYMIKQCKKHLAIELARKS
jgi:hypothetical protein